MTDLAESLVEHDVEVTALAGCGRYTGGERLPSTGEYKGVRIERAWSTNFGKNSIFGRLADYFSFYIGASWKLMRLPRHDIVMALTTPPLIGLVALLVARLRGMGMIALEQDIYPDVAVALGTLRQGSLSTRMLDYLNRFMLRGADRIIVLSECMRDRIVAKLGVEATERIDVIHNWADGAEIKPLESEKNIFSAQHGLNGHFVVLFSGNLGLINEFSTVLEAARSLRERSDIVFLFVGEGAKANEIRDFSQRHGLQNVHMLPYQPRELLRYSLAAGHVSLVTLADGLAGLSVPSKFYGVMAAGRPTIFVGDLHCDIAQIIEENNCGAVVASGDSQRLAQILTEWSSDREKITPLCLSARSLFEKRFDRTHAVRAYLDSFAKCMRKPTRA